jgi:hypothetical protein
LQYEPVAAIVRLAVLPIAIAGCPCPARLRGQWNQATQVGDDAKITDRRGAARWRGQPVVKAEVVKAGGSANTPRGQLRQSARWNALHARDAGIVHERGRDHADIAFHKCCPDKPLSLRAAGLPLSDIHGTTQ